MITVESLYKQFGKKQILKCINAQFDKGVYGLLGPNGAGKTTFVRCLTGVMPATTGKILWNEKNASDGLSKAGNVGYLPQRFGFYKEQSVRDCLRFVGLAKGVKKSQVEEEARRCIELVNLTDRYKSRIGSLSGGMLRRLGVAQALIGSPGIIFLDEPTAGLDPEERLRLKGIIKEVGKNSAVILSTHIIEDVEAVCDHILIMNKGLILKTGSRSEVEKLAEGKVYEVPGEVVSTEEMFVSKLYEKEGRSVSRVLSAAPPAEGMAVPPTVEDGYLCVVKELAI